MDEPKFWCLVPAAGFGTRLDIKTPKQYIELLGKPLVRHTLDCLIRSTYIAGIAVGLARNDQRWQRVFSDQPDSVVTYIGGESRADTVLKGLIFLEPHLSEGDWVLIHDAARPCVTTLDIERLVLGRGDSLSGAILAVATVDTIKKEDTDRNSIQTIPREKLWHAQTPQIFPYTALRSALETCDLASVYDESSAMEKAGYTPRLVVGSIENLKVTTSEDFDLAKIILQARNGNLQ